MEDSLLAEVSHDEAKVRRRERPLLAGKMEDKNLKVCSLLFLSNFQENWCQDNNSSQCSTTQLSLRFQVAVQTTLRHC